MECTEDMKDQCECEELGCKGCYYNKPLANTDTTYCINSECATKEECFRYSEHYRFDNIKNHFFMNKCKEYQG